MKYTEKIIKLISAHRIESLQGEKRILSLKFITWKLEQNWYYNFKQGRMT